jgi:hypothetical protein
VGLAVVGSATVPTACGDGCEDCPEPTRSDLDGAGMHLYEETPYCRSAYHVDGGECSIELTSPLSPRKRSEYPLFAGHGEAWHCPEGTVDSTVEATLAHTKSFEWKVEAELGWEGKVWLIGTLTAKIGGAIGGGKTDGVEAKIEQTIHAESCHRLEWVAYFLIGDIGVDFSFEVKRRWAWWTTNTCRDDVWSKGNVWVPCDSGSGVASRLQPLGSYVSINDRTCPNGCTGVVASGNLGWFPPLPPHLRPFLPPSLNPDDPPKAPDGAPPALPPPTAPPTIPLPPGPTTPTEPDAPPAPNPPDENGGTPKPPPSSVPTTGGAATSLPTEAPTGDPDGEPWPPDFDPERSWSDPWPDSWSWPLIEPPTFSQAETAR